MKRVVLAIGIPGAGKTTILRPLAERLGLMYICPDDIRAELTGSAENHSRDREAWDLAQARLAIAIEKGADVIVDATFTNLHTRQEFLRFLHTVHPREILGLFFDAPLAVAKERNANRGRVVSDEQMDMRHAHITQNPPALADGFDALYSIEQFAELEERLAN